VSPASWERLDAGGRIPAAVWLSGCKLWRRRELIRWIEAGCPDRRTWEGMQAAQGNSNGKR